MGRRHSPETRAKMSAARMGWNPSPETRAKIAAAQRGRKLSPETRARMSASSPRRKLTPEEREKLRLANLGRKHTPEHREKIRQAKLANPTRYWLGKKRPSPSAEARAKVSAANAGRPKPEGFGEHLRSLLIGKPRSAETVAKMRAALNLPEVRAKMSAKAMGQPCRHSKHPVFYNGRRFRSTYEVRVASALDALGVKWEYESRRFVFDGFTYCPDFYLPDDGVYWEVKGWYGPNSRRAVEAFRREHPDTTLVLFTLLCVEALEAAARRAA